VRPVLGVIGGSGLYEMDGLANVSELRIDTTYGAPSDVLVRGDLGDTTLLFLPRHGRGHRVPPHQINYRANVCAMKKAGATHLVSISAVGSMKEEIVPGHLVAVDQFIDLTKRRVSTFFEDGVAAHVVFAIRCARTCSARSRTRRPARAEQCTAAARTSAWRGRSSRRARRASSTARGACRSSG
jgi:purine nucleoside phosphorylase